MGKVGPARRAKTLIILGMVSIAALFVMYGRYQDPQLLTPDAIGVVQRIAYGFYIGLAASLGGIAIGMYRYHRHLASQGTGGLQWVIAVATDNKRARKVFAVTFVGYGIFFSLVSGMLVYQPEVNFSIHYGADIPSGFVAPCCGELGYMPKIIIYITEHVGLQVIPVNLVLQVTVSYLVGLNAAVAAGAYHTSKKTRGLGGSIGAAAGLFIACPTCAGTFVSIFVGTAGGIVLSAALAQMQTLFIAVSIPVLLVTPYIMAKKLRNPDGSCMVGP